MGCLRQRTELNFKSTPRTVLSRMVFRGVSYLQNIVIIWDADDDRDGNYWHICVEGHGITQEEAEEVLTANHPGQATSDSSGRPMVFGWTSSGKYIMVCYEDIPGAGAAVYPVTAYEVPAPVSKKRRRRKQ